MSALNQQEQMGIDFPPNAGERPILTEWSTFLPDLFGAPKHEEAGTRAWSPLMDELLRIRAFPDDWDGEGSEAPSYALVDGAITLALYLQAKGTSPADRVLAGVNGTIFFEWHLSNGYLEIEVTSPKDAESRWVRKGADTAEVLPLSRLS